MERRLAAILAADVVGYSRLMGEDEAGKRVCRSEMRLLVALPYMLGILNRSHRSRVTLTQTRFQPFV